MPETTLIPSPSEQLLLPHYLGSLSYTEGITAQDEAIEQLRTNQSLKGVVLGLEHLKPVITLGKRGRPEDDLKAGRQELEALGFEVVESPRGGQATLHAPGQLVIYPCVDLGRMGLGVRDYVCLLEKTTIRFLADQGIEAWRGGDEPGVYTAKGKIAFFGIRVSRGMASHGLAINAFNDLELFNWIRSCGKDAERFDSLKLSGREPSFSLEQLFHRWLQEFSLESSCSK
jgi:lipoyl(octanoyl) transferase 2